MNRTMNYQTHNHALHSATRRHPLDSLDVPLTACSFCILPHIANTLPTDFMTSVYPDRDFIQVWDPMRRSMDRGHSARRVDHPVQKDRTAARLPQRSTAVLIAVKVSTAPAVLRSISTLTLAKNHLFVPWRAVDGASASYPTCGDMLECIHRVYSVDPELINSYE